MRTKGYAEGKAHELASSETDGDNRREETGGQPHEADVCEHGVGLRVQVGQLNRRQVRWGCPGAPQSGARVSAYKRFGQKGQNLGTGRIDFARAF